MQLQLCTWAEVEDHLKNSTGIIVPIGSTEQHGPNGLIGTDALTAELIAQGIGEAADALVAPTIAVGMAQHHMAFTGSMTLRPSTLIAVVRDTVQSLARHGFDRVSPNPRTRGEANPVLEKSGGTTPPQSSRLR